MKADSPVIIVGAGRSGTTLLNSALGEHPDIYMAGETSFLLPRMWEAFFERPDYVRNYRLSKLVHAANPEWRTLPWFDFWKNTLSRDLGRVSGLADLERMENARMAQALGRSMADMLVPDQLRKALWGFKEIWNGGDTFNYDWSLYRSAFPGAAYLHCVRHPMTFAKSYFANNRKVPLAEDLIYALGSWTRIVSKAAELADDRYILIRYEDLGANPSRTIGAVLDFLNLPPDPRCETVMSIDHLRSNFHVELPELSRTQLNAIPGFVALASSLGYEIEAEPPMGA